MLELLKGHQNDVAYTNEEFYDNIMLIALGECYGEYHTAVRRYVELNKTSKEIQIEQDIRQLPPYLERLRDFMKLAMSCRTNSWKRLRGKKFAEYDRSFIFDLYHDLCIGFFC